MGGDPVPAGDGLLRLVDQLFLEQQSPPDDAMTINVVAKQWMWKFQHPSGQREINELHVPVGTPVRLMMTSPGRDPQPLPAGVAHQAGRAAGPLHERYGSRADKTGVYHLFCAEFCGTDHSRDGRQLIVMRAGRYRPLAGARPAATAALAASGRRAVRPRSAAPAATAQRGSDACTRRRWPGSTAARCRSPTAASSRPTTQYMRDRILLPNKQIAAGYKPIMPPFGNVLDEEQVDAARWPTSTLARRAERQ